MNSESFGLKLLEALWRSSGTRVCADGGGNRVLTLSQGSLIPEAVVGDLDSLTLEARNFYREKGVDVCQVEDQDRNDLDKAIEYLHSHQKTQSVSIVGAFGGRLDQVFATFDCVYRWSEKWPEASFRMYSDDNIALLLSPGIHHIHFRPRFEGPSCGLLPIGRACRKVTTTGLAWNLNDQPLEFGKQVSTSNAIVSSTEKTGKNLVSVTTSDPLLWTTSLKPLFDDKD